MTARGPLRPLMQGFTAMLLLCAASVLPLVGQTMDPALQRAAQAYDQAQITGNREELQRLVADDYILLNSRGKQEGKADLIEGFCHAGFHLQPYKVQEPFTKLLNGTAILGGLVEFKGTDDGKLFSQRLRFADVWAKRHRQWFVVFTQATSAEK
jgi:hypothetical protein